MSWKLSVVEWASNLYRGHNLFTTTSGTVASGQKDIGVSVSGSQHYWKKGDVIKIGPSADTDNIGDYEFCRIDSISGSTVTAIDNLTYEYASGDSVSGVGSGLPQGWTQYQNSDQTFEVFGLNPKSGTSGVPLDGYLISSACWAKVTAGASGTYSIAYTDLSRNVLSATKYRLGGYFRQSGYVNDGTLYRFSENSGVASIDLQLNSDNSSWTKAEGTGTTQQNPGGPPRILFYWATADGMGFFAFDCLYLTHASLTDGSAAGVYTIPVDPVQITEKREEENVVGRRADGGVFNYGSLDASNQRTFRLKFVDGTATFLRNLEILNYWQHQGNLLMLESDMSNTRPVFGYMDFKPAYSHWESTRIEIDLIFRGV